MKRNLYGKKTRPSIYLGPLTQSHLQPQLTVKQVLGFRKIKSIYVETMLLFKVI